MKAFWLITFSCIVCLSGCGPDPRRIEQVRKVLQTPRHDDGKSPWQEHADDLKPTGNDAIPLLATFLTDHNLGYEACETMLVIDADKAAPSLFASIPKSDDNVQRVTFGFFVASIERGSQLSFLSKRRMHRAAVRCLEADSNSEAAEQAILAIALTGSWLDFPLLESCRNRYRVATASLARLGQKDALHDIEVELIKPVPEPFPEEQMYRLVAAMMNAGFSQNPRFVPLLIKHLHDPPGDIPPSDMVPPAASAEAAIALDQIVHHTPSRISYSRTDWEKWWKENEQKYSER